MLSLFLSLFGIFVVVFAIYVIYHSIRVYQFLKWHNDEYIANITKRAKQRKYDKTPSWLNFSYDEVVTQEQFDLNMKYFQENRDINGGFYGTKDDNVLRGFAESCCFLGGARAALLQLTHPMVAISVKKHSYIIKRSKSNRDILQQNADIVNDCDLILLSKALKMRFNRTFAIMFPILFGPLKVSLIAAKKAWNVHKLINGYLQSKDDKEIIGDGTIFNSNTYYKASMVLPIRWVWATLIEGTIFMNQLMGNIKYKQDDVIEEMYQMSINTAIAFGLTLDQVPSTYIEFEEYYYYHMMQSNHIILCADCSKWCNVFFISNKWYMRWLMVGLHCYTALLFPKIVKEKFDKFDNNLLPLTRFRYIYGLLWIGLSRGIYYLLPLSIRYLNHYINLKQRVNGGKIHFMQKVMKILSGYAADHIVNSFIEG